MKTELWKLHFVWFHVLRSKKFAPWRLTMESWRLPNGVLEAHSEAEESQQDTVADSRQPLTMIRIRIKKDRSESALESGSATA
jgi:hypothetical protein